MHTLALSEGGEVFAWGDNGYGQCGNITETVQTGPILVPLPLRDGESAASVHAGGRTGLSPPPPHRHLAPHPTASHGVSSVSVHAGAFHSLVLLSSGRLLAFGDNSFGQLGGARQGYPLTLWPQPPYL